MEGLNIYSINIWEACSSEQEVLVSRQSSPDNKAIVLATTVDIANQVCYLVSTHTRKLHDVDRNVSNYQEIDSFSKTISCIIDTKDEPITFKPEIVQELLTEPILPKMKMSDIQNQPGRLFFAHCTDGEDKKKVRGQFWVYALDDVIANTIVTEHGNRLGIFDLDVDAILVELYPFKDTCVFWNADLIEYDMQQ